MTFYYDEYNEIEVQSIIVQKYKQKCAKFKKGFNIERLTRIDAQIDMGLSYR